MSRYDELKYYYMKSDRKTPYRSFGEVLKRLRTTASKSSAEVSGAVEIDEHKLHEYETGSKRPSEDILLLIIQHFGLRDDKAAELWSLAGYSDQLVNDKSFINSESGNVREVMAGITEQDLKIVYTDMVQVMVNQYGVIMNFVQGSGIGNRPLVISRIGMSKEHAKSVLEVLKKTLEESDNPEEPKRLKTPGSNK